MDFYQIFVIVKEEEISRDVCQMGREVYQRLLEAACAWDLWEVHSTLSLVEGSENTWKLDAPCICLKKGKAMSISSKIGLYKLLLLL